MQIRSRAGGFIPISREVDEQLSRSAPLEVLVVEDNVDLAEMIALMLRISGHRTAMVHDGLGALEAARRLQPDAMVLDIGLPGMDGFEVARLIRRDRMLDDTLLVAFTASSSDAAIRRAMSAGFDFHVAKPVIGGTLLQALASARPRKRSH